MHDTPHSNTQVSSCSVTQFKEAFSGLASGVSIITFDVEGHLHGFTATSLTPVSMTPPLALFCVARSNTSHEHLTKGTVIGISILAADQSEMSNLFAAKVRLGGYIDVAVNRGNFGAPLLNDSIAGLEGEVVDMFPAGDHSVYICALRSSRASIDRPPLLYHARGYHTLAELCSKASG